MKNILTNNDLVEGVFVQELKNRFLCEVIVSGKKTECYVPSSCRLSNFFELDGKTVLLRPTASPKSRTQFALFAVPFKKNYILLNTSQANRSIEYNIHSRIFSYLGIRKNVTKEVTVEGYKTDLFIEDSKTVIEIKSIISVNKTASFPTVFSQRTLDQLCYIGELLDNGYNAAFIIVSLSPYVERIKLDMGSKFYELFSNCMRKGLLVKGYALRLRESGIVIEKSISVDADSITLK